MELIEVTTKILIDLKEAGYKYVVHTSPEPAEEQDLVCCENNLVKLIPLKNMEEMEAYDVTLEGEVKHTDLDGTISELLEAIEQDQNVKYFIAKEYL